MASYRGSSPLARGTCQYAVDCPRLFRLIPARAGNICPVYPALRAMSAHPRSRGEHIWNNLWNGIGDGSSPLARGTFRSAARSARSARLIPARAGNIPNGSTPLGGFPAHPRSRGEHVQSVIKSVRQRGSSPLARGTYTASPKPSLSVRLIPARAGNIPTDPTSVLNAAAHPRSRGEHPGRREYEQLRDGSSPLARGTLG